MKTTTIEHLTIHRPANREELISRWPPGKAAKGVIYAHDHGQTDEEELAFMSCTELIEDERSAEKAKMTHTVVIFPEGSGLVGARRASFMQPPKACVDNKVRSIRARQDAIAAGVADPSTPLVGSPVPTRT